MNTGLQLISVFSETHIGQWKFEINLQFEFVRIEVLSSNETLLGKGEVPGSSPNMKLIYLLDQ